MSQRPVERAPPLWRRAWSALCAAMFLSAIVLPPWALLALLLHAAGVL